MNKYILLLLFSILVSLSKENLCYVLGVENLSDSFLNSLSRNSDKSYRVAVIANQTSCDQRGNRTVDILLQNGLRVLYILAPEHGFDGKVAAGKSVGCMVDQRTGIPIESMYGSGGDASVSGKHINKNILKQIDVIFFDLQDSGMRHYTYISTLLCALEGAAKNNKKIVILDRPNPLGGYMEGPLVDAPFKSFISIASIPLRHGMTIGELAYYFNKYVLDKHAELYIVKLRSYNRQPMITLTKPLSPNITSIQSCYGYSFLGLLGEVEPFEVGVGTQFAFQTLLLPDMGLFPAYEWAKLKAMLMKYGIHTHPYSYFNAKKRKPYNGLQINGFDMNQLTSFAVLLEILQFFKQLHVPFVYSKTFDKALGTDMIRALCNGTSTRWALKQKVNEGLEHFYTRAKNILLYEPHPKINKLV